MLYLYTNLTWALRENIQEDNEQLSIGGKTFTSRTGGACAIVLPLVTNSIPWV